VTEARKNIFQIITDYRVRNNRVPVAAVGAFFTENTKFNKNFSDVRNPN